METKIVKTVKEWLPWFIENDDPISEYSLLKKLAHYYIQQVSQGENDNAQQAIKIINLLYCTGNRHEKNAIENEFLEVLANVEAPKSLNAHMKVIPQSLREAYLKTILEN